MTRLAPRIFTNGVFDILHSGHVRLLEFAKSLGGNVIVGINSDASARRLKGESRPINNQDSRAAVLRALRCVTLVYVFEEDTPEQLISRLRPEFLVKGPEARQSTIPGQSFVESYGGKVVTPEWPIEESTTRIITRILKATQRASIPSELSLKVNGEPREVTASYQIMFVNAPDGTQVALYHEGRRVIDEFEISLSSKKDRDPYGRSA